MYLIKNLQPSMILLAYLLIPVQSIADEWVNLPFDSDIHTYDLGYGINPSGDKVGPCFIPTSKNRVPNGVSQIALRINDSSTRKSDTTVRSTSTSIEGGGSLGVGSGSAKYSTLKRLSNEHTVNDRQLVVVLDVKSSISSETSYDYTLSASKRALLGKDVIEFIKSCGSAIAVEINRDFRVVAELTFYFHSIDKKNSVMEKINASADGSYGTFSSKLSTAQQFDKVLSAFSEDYEVVATVHARTESGTLGVSGLSSSLTNAKTDPFKSALEGVSAYIKAHENSIGAVSKARFAPIESILPELDLVDWRERKGFWNAASELHVTLLGLDEIRKADKVNSIRTAKSDEDYLLSAAYKNICQEGIRDAVGNEIENRFTKGKQCLIPNERTDSYAVKSNLTTLTEQCLGAPRAKRSLCSTEALSIIVFPLLYPEGDFLSTVPYEFSPSLDEKFEREDGSFSVLAPEERDHVTRVRFLNLLNKMQHEDPAEWEMTDLEKVQRAIRCCFKYSPLSRIRGLTEDVDTFIFALYQAEISIYPYDVVSGLPTGFALKYWDGSSIFLYGRGVFIAESLEYRTTNGYSMIWKIVSPVKYYPALIRSGQGFFFWHGDESYCGPSTDKGCKAATTMLSEIFSNAREWQGDLYLHGRDLNGKFVKHIAAFRYQQ